MSFFYTEPVYKDPNQLELELKQFWPLTEQIPLEMSYEGCDTRTTLIRNEYPLGNGIAYTWGTVSTTITPSLTINPTNSVGELSIGGIRVGLETKPTWLQSKLHKLLGFNWKDK
jgi:hypothetical protein